MAGIAIRLGACLAPGAVRHGCSAPLTIFHYPFQGRDAIREVTALTLPVPLLPYAARILLSLAGACNGPAFSGSTAILQPRALFRYDPLMSQRSSLHSSCLCLFSSFAGHPCCYRYRGHRRTVGVCRAFERCLRTASGC